MSTDFSIRPVGAPVATPIVQPVSEAAHKAVATELPATQSVTAADAGARARAESDAVYQVVDVRTSAVVQQFPDEAVLRRRAYFHTLDLTKGEPMRALATDRKA